MPAPSSLPSFPGFDVIDVLGKGGFSTVYRARQSVLDRIVAVKVLDLDVHDDDDRRRFERECKAAGKLTSHANVVQLFGFGFINEANPYIVMEYMAGGSIAERLKKGALPVAEVVQVGAQIADALSAAHSEGIFHRDVKPENILVSDRGRVALGDFGISTTDFNRSYSAVNTSFTPLHTAPETVHGHPSTAASDIYSLGSTLYALLAGRAPFEVPGQSIAALLMQITTASPPAIDRTDVPPGLVELLQSALAKEPEARPASAAALRDALLAFADPTVTQTRTPTANDANRTVIVSGDHAELMARLHSSGESPSVDARRSTADPAHVLTFARTNTGQGGASAESASAAGVSLGAAGPAPERVWPGWLVPASVAASVVSAAAGFGLMALLRG